MAGTGSAMPVTEIRTTRLPRAIWVRPMISEPPSGPIVTQLDASSPGTSSCTAESMKTFSMSSCPGHQGRTRRRLRTCYLRLNPGPRPRRRRCRTHAGRTRQICRQVVGSSQPRAGKGTAPAVWIGGGWSAGIVSIDTSQPSGATISRRSTETSAASSTSGGVSLATNTTRSMVRCAVARFGRLGRA